MFNFFDFVALFSAAYCLVVALMNARYFRHQSEYQVEGDHENNELVSVLIPARNESESISSCVESLIKQTYRHLEIVVLDDRSDDDTFDMVERYTQSDSRVKIISGDDLPEGWIGKHWACHQLSKTGQGAYLLFIDADTVLNPTAIHDAMLLLKVASNDLVTFLPYRSRSCLLGYVVFPFIDWIIISWLPLKIAQHIKLSFLSASFGQFMLFKKEVYFSSGGHRSIKDIPTDDIELGRRVKKKDFRWGLYDGTKLLKTESYSTNSDLVSGISRSVFPSLNHSLSTLLVFSILLIVLGFYPWAAVVLSSLDGESVFSVEGSIGIISLLMFVGSWLVVCRSLSHELWTVFLYPFSFGLMILIALHSMIMYSAGLTAWKGRTVQEKKIRW